VDLRQAEAQEYRPGRDRYELLSSHCIRHRRGFQEQSAHGYTAEPYLPRGGCQHSLPPRGHGPRHLRGSPAYRPPGCYIEIACNSTHTLLVLKQGNLQTCLRERNFQQLIEIPLRQSEHTKPGNSCRAVLQQGLSALPSSPCRVGGEEAHAERRSLTNDVDALSGNIWLEKQRSLGAEVEGLLRVR
jgi:hypothetical protein